MKKKLLIRIVFFLSTLWLILLSISYIHSRNFQEHILDILRPYLDERLATEIHIQKDDIHFNLIKNFPSVSVSLNKLFIKSVSDPTAREELFSIHDTLLFANEVRFVFNMKSLFQKEYELKKIELTDASINLIRYKSGKMNYKIFKSISRDSLSESFSVDLKKISLKKVDVSYSDLKTKTHFFGKIKQGELSGNFSNDNFKIKAKIDLLDASLNSKNERIFTNQSIALEFDLGKEKKMYSIQDGTILYSGIKMSGSGKYNAQNTHYSFDLTCQSTPLSRLDFPVINDYFDKYHARFESGYIAIKSSVSGYAGKASPSITLHYEIAKGVIKYKDQNLKITDVRSVGQFHNGIHRNSKSSEFIIDTLVARSGKSYFSFTGSIKNFLSPAIKGQIITDLELEKVSSFVKLPENLIISGFVTGYVQFLFHLPANKSIQSIDWNKSSFTGKLTLHETHLEQSDKNIPRSLIKGELEFITISEVLLNKIIVHTGKSDLLINGAIKNTHLLAGNKDQFPVYQCEIFSNEFHTDDFLILNPEKKRKDPRKITFPDSIIVNAKFRAEDFHSGKFRASHVDGYLEYRPGILTVQNFSMESLGGSISSNLTIKESNNVIIAQCNARLNRVDIGNLFYTFNNFRQDVIQSENLDGALSGTIQFVTAWDQYLNLIPEKIKLTSQIRIDHGELIQYTPLLGLSAYIKVEELKHIRFETLKTSVEIRNKKVLISQTDIQSSAISLKGSGEHGFDKRYTYRLQVQLSDVLWKKAKRKKPENTEFGIVTDDGYGNTMIPLIITGDDTNYEVNYDKTTAKSTLKNKVQKEKELLKELFAPEKNKGDKTSFPDKDSVRIEWEEFDEQKASDVPEPDENEGEEFLIEWEDE